MANSELDFRAVHRDLLRWYGTEKRDLPWRKSLDPYRIWISEIMLQQTRVETVIPYYERFLSHYPNIQALAEADSDQLMNLWTGLGYYSRARNLQAAAQDIVARFGGKMPPNLEDLRSLKGIGAYTAAAIASIAFNGNHAAIDGNLERVFSRLIALRKNPKTDGRAEIQAIGDALVSFGGAGDFNQACMDLSSKVCLPKEPRCLVCPLQTHCRARALGLQREIPLKKEKKPPTELNAEGIILVSGGELLLARRAQGEWLSGLWDIPWWIVGKGAAPVIKNSDEFSSFSQTRTITKHKIHFEVKGVQCEQKPNFASLSLSAAEFRWVPLNDLHGINLPRPSEKALEATLAKLESI